jgi:curved DNA-binding protein CbpA
MSRQPNYYRILDVALHADHAQIQHAYRRLAKQHHPDLVPQERRRWARTQMARINAAYEVLGDPERRAAYDRQQGYTLPNSASVDGRPTSDADRDRRAQSTPAQRQHLRRERWRREQMSRQRLVALGSVVALGILLLGALYWWRARVAMAPQQSWTWAGLLAAGLCLVLIVLGRAVR